MPAIFIDYLLSYKDLFPRFGIITVMNVGYVDILCGATERIRVRFLLYYYKGNIASFFRIGYGFRFGIETTDNTGQRANGWIIRKFFTLANCKKCGVVVSTAARIFIFMQTVARSWTFSISKITSHFLNPGL